MTARIRQPDPRQYEQGSLNGAVRMRQWATLAGTQKTLAGGFPSSVPKRRMRPCPTCGAKPNQSCHRKVSGVIPGLVGQAPTRYEKMKGYHDAR